MRIFPATSPIENFQAKINGVLEIEARKNVSADIYDRRRDDNFTQFRSAAIRLNLEVKDQPSDYLLDQLGQKIVSITTLKYKHHFAK
ncbi:MAG TPA: hypothetical protein VFQ59_03515 [Candidatus Paceibacterota bacterium]|nr:hypothetical protein [Candidatus Paceibacterota bacterium]